MSAKKYTFIYVSELTDAFDWNLIRHVVKHIVTRTSGSRVYDENGREKCNQYS